MSQCGAENVNVSQITIMLGKGGLWTVNLFVYM